MTLAYKSWKPTLIFRDRKVKTSVLDGRDRGLSMTTNLEESGHGPFMVVFRPDRSWHSQFQQCEYGIRSTDRDSNKPMQLYKPDFFAVEQEWWSPTPVCFDESDVDRVIFMIDSPGARIHPKITRREWAAFVREFPGIKSEIDDRRYPKDDEA